MDKDVFPRYNYHDLKINLSSISRDADQWLSGRVSAMHTVVSRSISSEDDHVYSAD